MVEFGGEGGVLLEVAAGCHLEVEVRHGAEGVITHEEAGVVGEAVSVVVGEVNFILVLITCISISIADPLSSGCIVSFCVARDELTL